MRAPVVLPLLVLLSACSHAQDRAQETQTLWVAPQTESCVGVGPQDCLLIRRAPAGDWELFYDRIEGFEFEPGFDYELEVHVTERENPPADASSLQYHLVEMVSKKAAETSMSDDALTANPWQVVAVEGVEVEITPGQEATMEFDPDQQTVSGSGGCNRYSGSYQLEGSALTFGRLRTTMMACPDDAGGRLESEVFGALDRVASFRLEHGQLLLLDEASKVLLTLATRADAPLLTTEWEVLSYNNGRQAVVSVLIGTQLNSLFQDGSVSGSAGCNRYQASFELGDGTLTIGPAATTRKMCSEPDGIMEQESAFLAALASAATFRIDRRQLELRTASGALAVSLRAVSE